jgi:hypothetical protein
MSVRQTRMDGLALICAIENEREGEGNGLSG